MRKTYRFIKKDLNRQIEWRKFMRIFKAYGKTVPVQYFIDNGFKFDVPYA